MNNRLPINASSIKDVEQYYETRAKQLLSFNYEWIGYVTERQDGIFSTTFIKGRENFKSFYKPPGVLTSIKPIMLSTDFRIITTPDCGIVDYLKHIGKDHTVVSGHLDSPEYKLISAFYADKRARRSNVFLMNHIDEGISILKWLNATDDAITAYCLHPILQGDTEINENLNWVLANIPNTRSIALALEYRKTAMAYLSKHDMPKHGIELSPLIEVNYMLIADKIQNRKDFELYHKNTHPKSDRLDLYFKEWLRALGISEDTYLTFKNKLEK